MGDHQGIPREFLDRSRPAPWSAVSSRRESEKAASGEASCGVTRAAGQCFHSASAATAMKTMLSSCRAFSFGIFETVVSCLRSQETQRPDASGRGAIREEEEEERLKLSMGRRHSLGDLATWTLGGSFRRVSRAPVDPSRKESQPTNGTTTVIGRPPIAAPPIIVAHQSPPNAPSNPPSTLPHPTIHLSSLFLFSFLPPLASRIDRQHPVLLCSRSL